MTHFAENQLVNWFALLQCRTLLWLHIICNRQLELTFSRSLCSTLGTLYLSTNSTEMSEPPVTTPTPSHLTLLLKHARSTTVLSVLPDTPLSTLRQQLLQVLSARGIDHLPGTPTPLPTDQEDLELGILIDKHEPHKGWVSTEGVSSLNISKSSKKKPKGVVETVGDLELKDGGWIAYRVRGPPIGGDDEDEEIEAVEDPGWTVEIPSFDDEEGHVEGGPFGEHDGGYEGEEGYDEDGGDDEEMDIPIPTPRNAIAR